MVAKHVILCLCRIDNVQRIKRASEYEQVLKAEQSEEKLLRTNALIEAKKQAMEESAFLARDFALKRRKQKQEALRRARQKDDLPLAQVPDYGLMNTTGRIPSISGDIKRMSLGGAI